MFDAVIAEVQSPSEGAPLRHLDAEALASHMFQLGRVCFDVSSSNRSGAFCGS